MGLEPGRIRFRGVSRSFRVFHERNITLKETLLRRRRLLATDRWALREVDLDISPGEALGVIGQNGAGKSTLLKLTGGILRPQTGTVEVGGSIASMLELGAGFHPDFTGRENIFMNGAIHGLSQRQVEARLDEIIAFSELGEYIDMPVRTYSSGMYMRLGFSIAAHVDANVMLLDEVLAVGDAAFQRKCLGRIFEFHRRGGTILFVSHDAETVARICDRAILLRDGLIVADGPPREVIAEYSRQLAGEERLDPGSAASDAVREADAWGTGRVTITDVRVVGPVGAGDRVASGEPVTIELDVVAREAVPMPHFSIDIHAAAGFHVFGTGSQGAVPASSPLDGASTLAFRIPRLPLLEGRFIVSATARSQDGAETYHHLELCREFSVFQQSPGVGPVLIEGDWVLEEARAPDSITR